MFGEILLAVVIIVLAAVAFAVWACVAVVKMIVRAVTGPARDGRGPGQLGSMAAGTVACPQPRCRATNAGHARFCRRCGAAVALDAKAASRPAPMRYVA